MKKSCCLTVFLLLLGSWAQAQPRPEEMSMRGRPGPPHRGPGGERPGPPGPLRLADLDRLVEPLGLNPEQIERMRSILLDTGKESLIREGRIKVLDFTIKAELMAEEVNTQEIRGLHEELFRQKSAAAWADLEAEMAFKEVLTPEQARKYRLQRHRPQGPPPHPRLHGRGLDPLSDRKSYSDE